MSYVMYIQNGGNLGHAEFDQWEDANHAMKVMVARQVGVSLEQLDSLMDVSGKGPFFEVQLNDAYVASNGEVPGLSIRIEYVEEPLLAYASLNVEKTYFCLSLMEQFYSVLDQCKEKESELEMEPTEVLTLIGGLKAVYDCLQAVEITLDEEGEKDYQRFMGIMKFYLGQE